MIHLVINLEIKTEVVLKRFGGAEGSTQFPSKSQRQCMKDKSLFFFKMQEKKEMKNSKNVAIVAFLGSLKVIKEARDF